MLTAFRDNLGLVGFVVSVFALATSILTLWLVHLRRGHLKMTRPTMVCFLFDGPNGIPKICLRTLLYTTAARGQVIENLYLVVKAGDRQRVFDIWAYGEAEKLTRGSGLYVGQNGVAANHHFLLREKEQGWAMDGERYIIDVFASVIGWRSPFTLASVSLELSLDKAKELLLLAPAGCAYFHWHADTQKYVSHISHNAEII